MMNLLRLPRWLAGAFLLLMTPAFAYPAVALNCSTVQYFRSHYSEAELRQMARDRGYTAADIAAAEACLPPPPQKPAPLEHGKRSPTLPPMHTLKAVPKPQPAPVVAPVVVAPVASPAVVLPPEAPVIVQHAVPTEWLWSFLQYFAGILLIGTALGLAVTYVTKQVQAYRTRVTI